MNRRESIKAAVAGLVGVLWPWTPLRLAVEPATLAEINALYRGQPSEVVTSLNWEGIARDINGEDRRAIQTDNTYSRTDGTLVRLVYWFVQEPLPNPRGYWEVEEVLYMEESRAFRYSRSGFGFLKLVG